MKRFILLFFKLNYLYNDINDYTFIRIKYYMFQNQ